MNWRPRIALDNDIPELEKLIPFSARQLQKPYYSRAQIEAALGPVFGVDRQLIRDGTYYLVKHEGRIVGCGGWSQRRSLFGSDQIRAEPDGELDSSRDPARIRAFFVHPEWARRGIGRALLSTCEDAIRQGKFRRVELIATLAGEPLYASLGYIVNQRYEVSLSAGLTLPVVRMTKTL